MAMRDPITYVYYFSFGSMLLGGIVFMISPMLPVTLQAMTNLSFIGVGLMLLGFFTLFVILKGDKEFGEATSNKTESE